LSAKLKAKYDFRKYRITPHIGPELTFTRASDAWEPNAEGLNPWFRDDQPRYYGAWVAHNLARGSEDLDDAVWTNDGLITPVGGQEDPDGGETAWLLTEDTSTGFHMLSQDTGAYDDAAGNPLLASSIWFKLPADSTARYVWLAYAGATDTTVMMVLDLQEGIISDGSEYYAWDGNPDWEGLYTHPDGWYQITTVGLVTGATRDNLSFGISDGPLKTDVSGGHVGTDRSVLAWHPQQSQNVGWWSSEYPYNAYAPSTPTADGYAYYGQGMGLNYLWNSELYGYTGSGSSPAEVWWYYKSYISSPSVYEDYTWAEGGTGGTGERVDSIIPSGGSAGAPTQPSATPNRKMANGFQNACRCYGTNATYWLDYNAEGFWYWSAFQDLTFSILIEDIVTAPTGPVIALIGSSGIAVTTKTIDDRDEDGYISLTIPDGYTAVGRIQIGLGADGNNDTGDFTWSSPQLNEGLTRHAYLPNNNISWAGVRASFVEDVAPFRIGQRGIHIEAANTNLVASNNKYNATDWTPSAGVNAGAIAGTAWGLTQLGAAMYTRTTTAGGSAEASLSQDLTFETSTEYELSVDIFEAYDWCYVEITGLGALDISAYGSVRDFTGGPQVGAVGADCTASAAWEDGIKGSTGTLRVRFTSDAVDTAGTLKLWGADADGDNLVALNGLTKSAFCDINVQKGRGSSRIWSVGTSTPGSRAAEVLKTTDIGEITNTRGVIYARFRTGEDIQARNGSDKTVWSLSDGTANERMELKIIGSALVLEVVDGGVAQATITGTTTLTVDTEYQVAVYYEANDFEIYLDGSSEGTDTSGTLPTWTQLNIGSDWNDVEQLDGWIGEFQAWKKFKKSEMAALTSTDDYDEPHDDNRCGRTRSRRCCNKRGRTRKRHEND